MEVFLTLSLTQMIMLRCHFVIFRYISNLHRNGKILIFAVVIVIFCCKDTKKLSNTQIFLIFFTEIIKKYREPSVRTANEGLFTLLYI